VSDVMTDLPIIRLPDKIKFVAQDIYDTFEETGDETFDGYVPGKALADVMTAQQYHLILKSLQARNCIKAVQLRGALPSLTTPPQPYSFQISPTQLRTFLGVADSQINTHGEEQHRDKLILNVDSPEPNLRYNTQSVTLDSSSIEYFILKEVFTNIPSAGLDNDIVDSWGKSENNQTLYDACLRVNMKLQKLLKTSDKILVHKNGKFWIEKGYQDCVVQLTKTDRS